MSLNAKYRGKKPKKYFESKYGFGTREDNENFKRSIIANIATTELEETFLANGHTLHQFLVIITMTLGHKYLIDMKNLRPILKTKKHTT
jgi:hypothetical protein